MTRFHAELQRHGSLAIAVLPLALFLIWAVHNGGYDTDTWYWGALLLLATVGAALIGGVRPRLPRAAAIALAAFALYVAWSYLSITWATSKGDALQGSNRALLYLLVFGLMLSLPWTAKGALLALLTFAFGVGVIAVVLLIRLASADHVARLVIEGRLATPTGYFNSTAALFMMGALISVPLAARRELPIVVRGLLIALACAGLQLALIVESRGWLFTLPLVLLIAIVLVPDRLRIAAYAVLPAVAVLAPVHALLKVYKAAPGAALNHAAAHAGKLSLLLCGAMLLAATLVMSGERLLRPRPLQPAHRRLIGTFLTVGVIAVGVAGGVAATHGHPLRFASRQWHGFTHPPTGPSSGSHFALVGSGRYDVWRVSLDAFLEHPLGGLGQDNFASFYLQHRRNGQEPVWTHSLEMRLLAMTGIVGVLLFAGFIGAALTAIIRARRQSHALSAAVAAIAVLPLIVWLVHGSVDWFWEMPALSGPAFGFLAMAIAVACERRRGAEPAPSTATRLLRQPRVVGLVLGALSFIAAAAVLAFPYLSVREVSIASNARVAHPAIALRDLRRAADLNPLDATPGRLAGAIALRSGRYSDAQASFRQATARDSGDWFSWFGAGLAASALGEPAAARHDYQVAASINTRQSTIKNALRLLGTRHPLTPAQALQMLGIAGAPSSSKSTRALLRGA